MYVSLHLYRCRPDEEAANRYRIHPHGFDPLIINALGQIYGINEYDQYQNLSNTFPRVNTQFVPNG